MGTSCPAPDEVHVWHADVDEIAKDAESITRYEHALSLGERERLRRYRLDRDRFMFLGGRIMARALVGSALGRNGGGWQWRDGERGRPEIAEPETSLRFNLAHSAGLVVCALANARAVGVDVEDRARAAIDRGVVRRYCSPEEADDIEAQGAEWRDRFLIYWTLKEAYLKARGLGIAVPLAEIAFTLEPDIRIGFRGSLAGTDADWSFHLSYPTERHIVAVATPGSKPRVVENRWQWPSGT